MRTPRPDIHDLTGNRPPQRRLLPGLTIGDGFLRHPFDREFGVRTSGLIAGRHLGAGHPHDRHATAYYGVAPSVFNSLLTRWRRCRPAAPLDSYTFIDYGAGMGRAMLLAAEHPFRAVLGVELHPTLARIGRRNMQRWRLAGRAQASMRMHCCDATEFKLPAGRCVAFLFNPFGAPVLRRLVRQWARQFANRPGELDILYVNNEQEIVLRTQPGFERLFAGPVRRSPADAAAERNILNNQPDGEYMATPWEDCSIFRWAGK
ncbi:MAG: class I SAM-dependent methyltransferase [Acidobacteriota bacterium]